MAPVQASDDPRAARSRYAIRAAARHLLETEGPAAVTHQRVALEAGVGRATVYRHWPGPDQLLQEVIGEVEFPFFRDPQTPVRDWMFEELRRLADELALPALAGVAITLMHRGRWDPSIADQRDQLLNVVNHRLAAAIDYAARAGELARQPPEPSLLGALLLGPLLYRTAMQALSIPDQLIERAIQSAIPWRNREPQGRAKSTRAMSRY
jgi:AcrR family transcriptional regulator